MYEDEIIKLIHLLFPINRSITGQGNRKTLKELKKICNKLSIKSFKSGTKVFDWKIPDEWNVNNAYIVDPNGNKLLNFKENNLHLVSYSVPIKKYINFNILKRKIYSIKSLPSAIPYRTSYYNKDWGFCMSYNEKKKLKSGKYFVNIDSNFKNGKMHYGELFIKGKSKKEILLTSNICHPSLVNNELSGPCLLIYLAKYLLNNKNLNYSYRLIFIPETIGSIAYINKNLNYLKKNIIFGISLICLSGKGNFSLIKSKFGNKGIDNIAVAFFKKNIKKGKIYSWLSRGSDERQFGSPLIDIPFISISKTKFDSFKEYHTSLDNLDSLNKEDISKSFRIIKKFINTIEKNIFPKSNKTCEPFFQKYKLYKKVDNSALNNKLSNESRLIRDFLSYSDGYNSLNEISKILRCSIKKTKEINKILINHKIIE